MLRNRTKAFLSIAATFIIGVLLGGGASYLIFGSLPSAEGERSSSRPWERREKEHPPLNEIVDRLNKDASLNLTEAQRSQILEIIRSTREEYDRINDESRERFSQARKKSREEIRWVLDPQQMENFDQFLENRKKRRNKGSD